MTSFKFLLLLRTKKKSFQFYSSLTKRCRSFENSNTKQQRRVRRENSTLVLRYDFGIFEYFRLKTLKGELRLGLYRVPENPGTRPDNAIARPDFFASGKTPES